MKQIEYDPKVFETLNEKLEEIEKYCLENRIPIFITYAKELGGNTEYGNTVVTPINVGVYLTDDRITKYNASLNENLQLRFKRNTPTTFSGDLLDSIIDGL